MRAHRPSALRTAPRPLVTIFSCFYVPFPCGCLQVVESLERGLCVARIELDRRATQVIGRRMQPLRSARVRLVPALRPPVSYVICDRLIPLPPASIHYPSCHCARQVTDLEASIAVHSAREASARELASSAETLEAKAAKYAPSLLQAQTHSTQPNSPPNTLTQRKIKSYF